MGCVEEVTLSLMEGVSKRHVRQDGATSKTELKSFAAMVEKYITKHGDNFLIVGVKRQMSVLHAIVDAGSASFTDLSAAVAAVQERAVAAAHSDSTGEPIIHFFCSNPVGKEFLDCACGYMETRKHEVALDEQVTTARNLIGTLDPTESVFGKVAQKIMDQTIAILEALAKAKNVPVGIAKSIKDLKASFGQQLSALQEKSCSDFLAELIGSVSRAIQDDRITSAAYADELLDKFQPPELRKEILTLVDKSTGMKLDLFTTHCKVISDIARQAIVQKFGCKVDIANILEKVNIDECMKFEVAHLDSYAISDDTKALCASLVSDAKAPGFCEASHCFL